MTIDKEHQAVTRGIKHWGLSGYSSVLPRTKFGVTGQESSPQSPTISYRQPLCAIIRQPLDRCLIQNITSMKETIFPILGFLKTDKSCDNLIRLGSGFFINNSGNFISVAHNFNKYKNKETNEEYELNCFAYIDNELLEIEILYYEYNRDENGCQIYKDLAIGHIAIKSNILKLQNDKLSNIDTLIGYSIRKLNYPIFCEVHFKENLFYLYEIPISTTGNCLYINKIKIASFPNVLFFKETEDLFGLSGCPVLNNDKIVGVLSSKCFIKREYFLEIINLKLNIEFI